jgi:RNA polymerase sigma factor (sigma-70 family)
MGRREQGEKQPRGRLLRLLRRTVLSSLSDHAGRVERIDPGALHRQLCALAEGHRAAFHPLFVGLWPLLRGFAARSLPWEDAEEVAQEALLRVLTRAHEFDARREALPWILGIAANEIRTARRRHGRRREDSLPPTFERADPQSSPEAAAIAADLARAVQEALSTLRPGESEALLAYARGERPDLPGPTFRKRISRALARLRNAWSLRHDDL